VTLDVLPADVPAEYAPAMVTACSDALAQGRCALAQTLPESTQPEAVALVLWQGDGFLQVTVRVGRGGGQWVARALSFSERDSISERWTTVGLTVATLVGETRALDARGGANGAQETPAQPGSGQAPSEQQPPRPVAPPSVASAPATSSAPAARPSAPPASRWQGRVGAVTGPGWDAGGWRVGSWVALGFRIPRTPVVLHTLGSYALSNGPSVHDGNLSTRWATLGLGAGVTGTWAALDLGGTAAVDVAYRRVDVDFRGQGASDQEVPVSLLGLLSFPASGALAATGGLVVRLPPVNPNETSGLHVRGPAFAAEVIAGLEVRL
jgi:hypothetical protein